MYKICFLFKTMTSRFKSSSYNVYPSVHPIPPPPKKNPLVCRCHLQVLTEEKLPNLTMHDNLTPLGRKTEQFR